VAAISRAMGRGLPAHVVVGLVYGRDRDDGAEPLGTSPRHAARRRGSVAFTSRATIHSTPRTSSAHGCKDDWPCDFERGRRAHFASRVRYRWTPTGMSIDWDFVGLDPRRWIEVLR